MHRLGVGGSAGTRRLFRQQQGESNLAAAGESINESLLQQAKEQYAVLTKALQEFAGNHAERINRDPEFRQSFHEMCTALGVDPLVSNKGLWSQLLNVGNFYSELAIQILTVCLITRSENGGLLSMRSCLQRIHRMRGGVSSTQITKDDVRRALEKLQILGEGAVVLLKTNKEEFLVSVPEELNEDQVTCLRMISNMETYHVTLTELCKQLGWNPTRSQVVLDFFLREGIVWVDIPQGYSSSGEVTYYFVEMALQEIRKSQIEKSPS